LNRHQCRRFCRRYLCLIW